MRVIWIQFLMIVFKKDHMIILFKNNLLIHIIVYENIYLQLISITRVNVQNPHIYYSGIFSFPLSNISVPILPWREEVENGSTSDCIAETSSYNHNKFHAAALCINKVMQEEVELFEWPSYDTIKKIKKNNPVFELKTVLNESRVLW